MIDAFTWAVITPDGRLTWYPATATAEVETIVAGAYPGATDDRFVSPPLFLRASDVALLFPEEFEPNPVAEAVIFTLSGGRITQPWRGAVALYECERGPYPAAEWVGPMVMTPEWRYLIETAVERAAHLAGTEADT